MVVEKKEGGASMSEIRGIVEQVLAEKQEKDQTSQELGEIRKEVTELKGEFGKVQQGMYCTSDGKFCFYTPEELSAFMKDQKEKLNGVEAKIGEVATRIKEMTESKAPAPDGPALVGIPKEGFDKLTSEQQKKIKDQIAKGVSHSMLLDIVKECARSDNPKKCLLLKNVLKDYDAEEIIKELPEEKRGKAVLLGCKDGQCRIRLAEEGEIRIYKKGERGEWRWVDEPKEEARDKGGFSVF